MTASLYHVTIRPADHSLLVKVMKDYAALEQWLAMDTRVYTIPRYVQGLPCGNGVTQPLPPGHGEGTDQPRGAVFFWAGHAAGRYAGVHVVEFRCRPLGEGGAHVPSGPWR